MGGGGVTADTCPALNRRCWSVDMIDRPDTRPEIEPYYWDVRGNFKLEDKEGENRNFSISRRNQTSLSLILLTLIKRQKTIQKRVYPCFRDRGI
jgi:hypothetical protein